MYNRLCRYDPDTIYLDRWEVYDRTAGKKVDTWSYDKETQVSLMLPLWLCKVNGQAGDIYNGLT